MLLPRVWFWPYLTDSAKCDRTERAVTTLFCNEYPFHLNIVSETYCVSRRSDRSDMAEVNF